MKFKFCQRKILENHADAILFLAEQNRFWITEFSSSAGAVIVTKNKIYTFLDGRYFEKAKIFFQNSNIELKEFKGVSSISEFLESLQIKDLLIEGDYMVVQDYLFFKQHIDNLIQFNSKDLRIIKTPGELSTLKIAAKIVSEAMEQLKMEIKAGMSEKEVAALATYKLMLLGAEKNSFDPIVASGPNGAFPHHKPTERKLVEGEYVTIDMGCIYKGYCSDLTRTFPIGKPSSEDMKTIYDIVYQANMEAIKAVRAGVTGAELDKIARDVVENAGYGQYFNHSTGHGLGIDVHELPNVSKANVKPIPAGSVITIEPGIYVPGIGGVRIEDDVYVSEQGNIILTAAARK